MERKKGVVEICYPVVLKIYKKMHLWKIPVPGRDRVKTDLSRLYPGENQEERITEYYVRKLTMSLMIFFVGIHLILFVALGKSEGNPLWEFFLLSVSIRDNPAGCDNILRFQKRKIAVLLSDPVFCLCIFHMVCTPAEPLLLPPHARIAECAYILCSYDILCRFP